MRIRTLMRVVTVAILSIAAGAGCRGKTPTAPEPPALPSVEVSGMSEGTGYARIDWKVRNGADLHFSIERQHLGQPWKPRAMLSPDLFGRMSLEDATVSAGESYQFRVRVPRGDPEYQGMVLVHVPR